MSGLRTGFTVALRRKKNYDWDSGRLVIFRKPITVYKRAYQDQISKNKFIRQQKIIITLEIPAGVLCRIPFKGLKGTNKCRSAMAIVKSIVPVDRNYTIKGPVRSEHDRKFIYKVGAVVHPKQGFTINPPKECASGIHWFFSRKKALTY